MKALLIIFLFSFIAMELARAEDPALDIDVSGKKGDDGTDGADGDHKTFPGSGDGGDATTHGTPGKPGEPGSKVTVELKSTPKSYEATVKIEHPEKAPVEFKKELRFNAPIRIKSVGGDGGTGGRGGDGGDGANGIRGSDGDAHADPERPGTDGGPAGSGGDATNAGRGGDAGGGGDIIIRASFDNIYLFANLLEHLNHAGVPGKARRAGRGGRPGTGGQGGRPDSYDERVEDGVEKDEETTRDGDIITVKPVTRTKYKTITHSVKGGEKGPDGTKGADGNPASDGLPQPDGDFYFEIEGRPEKYRRLFDLTRGRINIVDTNGDGKIEPDELAYLDAFSVQNPELMPTPPTTNSNIEVYLAGDQWHRMEGKPLLLPKSLAHQELFTFSDRLAFRVNDITGPSINKPFRQTIKVAPRARINPTGYQFPRVDGGEEQAVEFPIQLRLEAPPALAKNQSARLRLIVSNTSNLPLGVDSLTGRKIVILIEEDGAQPHSMDLLEADGKPISLAHGFPKEVRTLEPHTSYTFDTKLRVPDDFEEQGAYDLQAKLNLGRLDKPGEERAIQSEKQRIGVAAKYRPLPESNIAMIINNETRPEEKRAWVDLLEKELGFSSVNWHVAYYGNFDLEREIVPANAKFNLLKDLASKTHLVLNYPFKTHSAEWLTTWEQLSKSAFLNAVGTKDISFLVLGPEAPAVGGEMFIRTKPGAGSRKYTSTAELIQSLHILHRDRKTFRELSAIREDFHLVPISGLYWGTPKPADLDAKAADLHRQLRTLWPSRHYVVVPQYRGTVTVKGGLLSRNRVDLGDLIVQRLPDRFDPLVTYAVVSGDELHSPSFPSSRPGLTYLMAGLNYDDRIQLLGRLLDKLNGTATATQALAADILVNTMLKSIVFEYDLATLGAEWHGSKSPRTIAALGAWSPKKPGTDEDLAVIPGSDAEKILVKLYVGASMAGYYAYTSTPFMGGNAKPACQSAQADLTKFGRRLLGGEKSWAKTTKLVNQEMALIFKEAGATGWTASTSFSSTLNEKVRAALFKGWDDSDVKNSLTVRADLQAVMPQPMLDSIAQRDEALHAQWADRLRKNLQARESQKLP